MDIKDFLKPTITKIILFIILIGFIPFIEPHGIQCIKAPCPQPGTQSLFTQFTMFNGPIVGIYYTNLIIGLIASYLVACVIVLLVKKFRQK